MQLYLTYQWCRNCRSHKGHDLNTFCFKRTLEIFKVYKHFNYNPINTQCLNRLLHHMCIVSCCFACQLYWHGCSMTFSHLLIIYSPTQWNCFLHPAFVTHENVRIRRWRKIISPHTEKSKLVPQFCRLELCTDKLLACAMMDCHLYIHWIAIQCTG